MEKKQRQSGNHAVKVSGSQSSQIIIHENENQHDK
jgi:hypothetical protein